MEFYDTNEDEYERYKILKPIVQKHKRYFFIQNLQKVADNLQVQAIYLIEYICIKTNSQSEVYQKSNYLIKAPLVQIQVEELIEEFIDTYLRCNKCQLLEYQIKVNKDKKTVQSKCASCGAYKIHNINEKMNSFILKNPPIIKKKHDIEISRGFLNEFNQDYEYSDSEDEEKHYSYEDSEEEGESEMDSQSEQEEEPQQESSSSEIGFEDEDIQEQNIEYCENQVNENQKENIQGMQLSSSKNSQITLNRHEPFSEINMKSRLDNFFQTNQQKQQSAPNHQYHEDIGLIEKCNQHKINQFEMAQS